VNFQKLKGLKMYPLEIWRTKVKDIGKLGSNFQISVKSELWSSIFSMDTFSILLVFENSLLVKNFFFFYFLGLRDDREVTGF
jgi:hypothetical protein